MQSRHQMPAAEHAPGAGMLDRPFYFILVLWGERFRNYFLDLCLPTLLSPRNLPSLSTRPRSKFLFCTCPDDWAAISASPIFQLLERCIEPVYIEIPPCPPGVSGCVHMGIGHRRGCEMAYEAKAYPFVLTPDSIFSDGTIARLQELALAGVQLALVPALRFAEEPLFNELRQAGISPLGRTGLAEPIAISNRDLARMALASMHSETRTYEWDAPFFHRMPSAAWWRVPGEDGIVVHCLSWAPLLFDFTAVPEHDTSVFDDWTFDGDYIFRNLGNIRRIHLVLDSDEIFMASWAPLSDRPHDLTPQRLLQVPFLGSLLKKQRFNAWFYGGVFDPLKQSIFFSAARWHARPLNREWTGVEQRALATLATCVAPPKDAGVSSLPIKAAGMQAAADPACSGLQQSHVEQASDVFTRALLSYLVVPFFRAGGVVQSCWIHREAIIPRLRQVARGDAQVRHWIAWRLRQLTHQLLGRNFRERRPERPTR
jgi:hypothetical protein